MSSGEGDGRPKVMLSSIVPSITTGWESNVRLRHVSIGFGEFVGLSEKVGALSVGTEMREIDGDILESLEDAIIQAPTFPA